MDACWWVGGGCYSYIRFEKITVLTKFNTVLTKKNTVLAKFNTVLTKFNTVLMKKNTVLAKFNTVLTKKNTVQTVLHPVRLAEFSVNFSYSRFPDDAVQSLAFGEKY